MGKADVSCQTYEGGFGGLPGMEAHGGYSFCALAALILLNKEKLCDVDALLRWTTNKQMRFEGGFQGRTNKLVDGCYTFWQGAIVPLIHGTLFNENDASLSEEKWMFHQGALQEYVLICCQCPYGGLVDKPGKTRDFYHTCYCLSGLSVAQHYTSHNYNSRHVVGNRINELKRVHPVYNICVDEVASAIEYYRSLPVPLCGSEKEGADATS
ncbi:PREDICTED: protein farnesyltransferase subunit beta-like [Priapulus caudatus]|uniref:Protein farnesyltransferase subunit beta-like n=1 Tax=Priapulus caudatus TaxID=37621 RepID=A0ABM1EK16_PRICU|nr:PREDICTED: protein farnesyltransferase subunit beta-like [Priapulus caudatus]